MRNNMRYAVWCFAAGLLLLIALQGRSQTSQTLSHHNWYFGNATGAIKFNRVTNVPSLVNNKAIPFGTGGSSVATDHNTANLLFYTDGNSIFDITHVRMPNGNGINANSTANQPTAICAIPGQNNKYFLFTNTANFTTGGTIFRSVIDMGLFGNSGFPSPPFGDVETKNTAVGGLAARAEAMITVPHANGNDFWLITQQVSTQSFTATLINAASYTAGTFASIVSSSAPFPTTAAHFAYHPGLRKVAVAPQDPSTDAIILNFNDATGILGFDRIILNSGFVTTTNQSVYDIEWSPTGQYLYLSRHGEPGVTANVFQYDYQNSAISLAPILPAAVFRSYGLQLAPDTTIYHLYQTSAAGPFVLGRIEKPDTIATEVNYNPSPFATTNFSGTQFPSFLPRDTITLSVSFTTVGSCQNSPTNFFPLVSPGADSLIWDFGDASFGRGWGPVHTYATAAAFNVTLTAFYQGQTQAATQPVAINAFALQLQVTQDTTACRCEFPPPRGPATACNGQQFSVTLNVQGGTPTSVIWSNGDMGNTLRPDSAGYYYVVVTDAAGCTGYAGVNVKEYGLQDQTANKWYFGDRAGIDFNTQPPAALSESVMNAPEGCAIVCDRNGETIFYTDGQSVYNKTHVPIASSIGGNPASTQSALIVAVPGDETLYYIFTTQAINGTDSLKLMYSLFDLKLNAGVGAVVKQNVFLFAKSTERITSNGNWLIAHEYGNNTFRAYQITAQGIGDVVYSSIGSDHSFASQQSGEGYMKLGPRNNLAVALSSPGSNHIELFHLNDSVGSITNYRDIDLNEPAGQIYGVEFSPGGNKLFATVRINAASSALFEYSIDSVEQPHFKQRVPAPAELGAIQVGPNGQIYVAVNDLGNNAALGTISPNEDTTLLSSFVLNGFPLAAGTVSHLGLPNFVQINSNALGGPTINIAGVCIGGDSTRFSATPRDQIDEYFWRVLQGGSQVAQSDQATFAHLFTTAGNYTVSLRLSNRCAPDTTLTRSFTIFDGPLNPTAGVVLCTGPATLDANPPNAPNLIYLWTTDETTETISVNQQGSALVFVLDTLTGCFVFGQFIVADNRPLFDLGPDLTICEDNATPALNAQNPGTTYQWTVNGVNTSNAQALAVDTTTPGVFIYAVTVTDPVTSCAITDNKTYDIKVSPAFAFSGTNPISCGSPTGSVTLQLNASNPAGGPLYSYFISGPGGTAQSDLDETAPNTYTIPNRVAGTYSAIVTDQISGCTLSAATGLTDATYTASAVSQLPNCDPVTVRITTAGAVTYPVQYTATNGATGVVTTGVGAASGFNTTPLAAGDYVIDIRDNSVPPCTFTFNHTVAPVTPAPVSITPDLCNLTLTASGATGYTWTSTPAGGISGPATGATIQLTPNFGQVTYDVTGASAGCPSTQTVSLNVGPGIGTPTLSQSTPCSTNITMTVTPAGANFTYRWFRNGTLDGSLGGSSNTFSTADNGDSFVVTIVESQSGCTRTSPALTASVQGLLTGTLTTTPPCEDGLPVTLTATTTAPAATFSWTLDGALITGATTSSISQSPEGTYRVEIRRGPCAIFLEIDVIRAPLPDGQLPNRLIICNDPENADPATKSVDLDPGVFAQYDWSINNLSINYTQQVLTADSEGLYEVELINEFACVAIDETEILSECLPKINAPNVFRPGSNAINPIQADLTNSDFWVISKFIEEDKFQIFIYNRWGEMVFSSDSRSFKWNGGYNNNAGQPLPPGTYSYIIKFVSAFRPDKGVQEKRGGVALLR